MDVDSKKLMTPKKQNISNLDIQIPILNDKPPSLNKVEILTSSRKETVILRNGKKIVVRKLNNDCIQHEIN